MRPFTSGRGTVLTSLSGPDSPARDARTRAQSGRIRSCFVMAFTVSPNAFMVFGNFPCATGRVCGLSVTTVSGNTTLRTVNRAVKIVQFLALKRNTVLVLGALVLALTGERLWLGFAPKYLETLGASVLIIGLFDALQTLLGAVYAYPGGWLADHWGERRSLMLFNALSLAGYVLVLLWQHWLALVLGVFLFLAWSALSLPATLNVVAISLDKRQHTMGIGVQSMVRRLPMMIGPLIGGWLISRFGW